MGNEPGESLMIAAEAAVPIPAKKESGMRRRLLVPVLVGLLIGLSQVPSRAQTTEKLLETFCSEFVEITPGTGRYPKSYRRGSEGAASERPVQEVTIAAPFSIARYEVPQNLYEAIMGEDPSRWKGKRNSVEMMTYAEAEEFCQRLTVRLREQKKIPADRLIRLPTEAEWEYCCRAGTDTAYSFGDSAAAADDPGNKASLLDPYGWHTGNAAGNDPPVGALKANPWGLYDMHGYLAEFCSDPWSPDHSGAPTDGTARTSADPKPARVIRGGSWKDRHPDLRSAARKRLPAEGRDDAVGFRCVLSRAP